MRRQQRNRRGMTAVLVMLYLSIFATLALGFYATVTTAVQVAGNEQRTARALLAAESGMSFMKFHLANLGVPPKTPTDQLFLTVHQKLCSRLNGFPNMRGQVVQINAAQDLITIPPIQTDAAGAQFSATLVKMQNGQQLRVKVNGNYSGATANRATQLDYAIAQDAAKIFNYGVASKSAISMNGNVTIRGINGNNAMGSVLSATTSTNVPLVMSGNAKISGDVSFVNPNASPSIGTNCTIADLRPTDPSFSQHVHKNVPEVPFPTIDTSAFVPFVPPPTATGPQVITARNPAGTTFKNIRIKANTNPTFNADTTIQGVCYIEVPNQVKFNGQVNIQGAIVVQTDNNSNESLDPTQNTIIFAGGVTATPMNTLPATSDFPAEERALNGAMVLAPGFGVTFGGNFGTISGSIVASQLSFGGTAGGTVTGSVINMNDTAITMGGTSDIIIQSVGTSNYPAGVFFGSHYAPLPYTYVEAGP